MTFRLMASAWAFLLLIAPGMAAGGGFDLPAKSDFGVVQEGDPVKLELKGKNTSADKLKLLNIKATCSCTTAHLDKKEIAPGEEALLTVEVDTRQKSGHMAKLIRLFFEGVTLPVIVHITGSVEASGNIHNSRDVSELFKGKCADCHASAGQRHKGYQLYLADCAFCHGVFGEGLSAKSLRAGGNLTWLKNIIMDGSADKKMPAFGDKKKGPLTQQQIDTLAVVLEKWDISPGVNDRMSEFSRGSLVYAKICSSCHGVRRTGPIGASITINDLRKYDHAQLEELLKRKNSPLMPSFSKRDGGLLADEDIRALVGYLKGAKFPGK